MSVSERRLRLASGLELAARVHHPGAPHRVLALHGWLDNAASFDALAECLPDCELVALDLAGHGWSDHRPAGTWYAYVDYLDEILDALDQLGWSSAHWLGHSLGGALLSLLAAAHPERVERLVLIESLGPLAGTAERATEQLRRALADRARQRQELGGRLRIFAEPGEAIEARCKVNGLSLDAATALVRRGLRAVDGGYTWSSDPRLTLASPVRVDEAQIHTWLRSIVCPTLLLLAEPPMPFLPADDRDARLACLGNAQVLSFSGHHHLHMETPAPLAEAIMQFLSP